MDKTAASRDTFVQAMMSGGTWVLNTIRRVFAVAILTALVGLAAVAPATANPTAHTNHAAKKPPAPKRSDTHVYLMRGLFGVFSLGMDDLAGKLNAKGYRSDIYAWDNWQNVSALVAKRYEEGHRGPVVVIGHSLGANSVFAVADDLHKRGIPVEIGVTFDATQPGKVPSNVTIFINFWARDGFGHPVQPSPDFAGDLEDYDLSSQPGIDHTNIDALDRFHQFIIGKLDGMTTPD
jgi:hypothetical protein